MAKRQKKPAKEQYSYAERGKVKVSVPLTASIDGRLTKLAASRKLSKAKLAAELLANAL